MSRPCRRKKLPSQALFFFPDEGVTGIAPTKLIAETDAVTEVRSVTVNWEGEHVRAEILDLSDDITFLNARDLEWGSIFNKENAEPPSKKAKIKPAKRSAVQKKNRKKHECRVLLTVKGANGEVPPSRVNSEQPTVPVPVRELPTASVPVPVRELPTASVPVPVRELPTAPVPVPVRELPTASVPVRELPTAPVPVPVRELPTAPVPVPVRELPTAPVPVPVRELPTAPVPVPVRELPTAPVPVPELPTTPAPELPVLSTSFMADLFTDFPSNEDMTIHQKLDILLENQKLLLNLLLQQPRSIHLANNIVHNSATRHIPRIVEQPSPRVLEQPSPRAFQQPASIAVQQQEQQQQRAASDDEEDTFLREAVKIKTGCSSIGNFATKLLQSFFFKGRAC